MTWYLPRVHQQVAYERYCVMAVQLAGHHSICPNQIDALAAACVAATGSYGPSETERAEVAA